MDSCARLVEKRGGTVALAEEDAIATLKAIADNRQGRCILPWIPLMRGGDRPEVIAAWKEQAERITEPARRLDYGAIAVQFAELTGCDAVWRKELEGWNVEESRVLNEWISKAEAKAEAKGLRRSFMEVVESRFPGGMSPELRTAVERQADLIKLSRWIVVAATASDVTQLKASIFGEATTLSRT